MQIKCNLLYELEYIPQLVISNNVILDTLKRI